MGRLVEMAVELGRGAVVHSAVPAELVQLVAELHADPERRAALAAAGRRVARPDAAERIASNVLARLDAARA